MHFMKKSISVEYMRPTVNLMNKRILLPILEIGRFDYPALKLYSLAGSKPCLFRLADVCFFFYKIIVGCYLFSFPRLALFPVMINFGKRQSITLENSYVFFLFIHGVINNFMPSFFQPFRLSSIGRDFIEITSPMITCTEQELFS